jgi:hypothetical protein
MATLRQARVNPERTRIVSSVDGYVTNLLVQLGDYMNVGGYAISVVEANSVLGRRIFREDKPLSNPRGRSGANQADGPRPDRARPRRQHRPRDQRFKCAAQRSRDCDGQSHLHLAAPTANRLE